MLNLYSSRSFHDINQYPVFPWIITNTETVDDKACLRYLGFPVSAQTEEKRIKIIAKYEDEEDDCANGNFKLHFRCNYSTSAFVSYYLVRLNPYTNYHIKFQSGKFDLPNRMFSNIREVWEILEKHNDNRELTPEFFVLPEIFINFNCHNYGRRPDSRVDDLILPLKCLNAIDFTYKHKLILNSRHISLNLWIDNVFGINQLNKNKESVNIFPMLSYEQEVNLKKELEKLSNEKNILETTSIIKDKVQSILNFGQIPAKIFDDKHPVKSSYFKNSVIEDDFSLIGGIIQNWKNPEVAKFKRDTRYFNYSKSYLYVLNSEREIEILDRNNFKPKHKFRIKKNINLNFFKLKDHDYQFRIYRDKNMLIELQDCKYFVVCRYLDYSIKIYQNDSNIKEILTESVI